MKNYLTTTLSVIAVLATTVFIAPLTVRAQDKMGMAGHKPVETVAMKFAKAGETWSGILADRKSLLETIKSGKLSEAHELAFSIRDGVVTLPYKSSGLAPIKQKSLIVQVKNVAAIAENIDKYADAGNAAKTRIEYAKLTKALDTIEALYPANALPSSGTKPMSAADRRCS